MNRLGISAGGRVARRRPPGRGGRALAGTAAALTLGTFSPGPIHGQIDRVVPPAGATTITSPITERYRESGFSRWLLGGGYRDVWATPVRIDVLDLEATANGLTPVETGGYGQTVSLEFLAGDGLEYAVRSIDKDPTRRLDSLFLGTIVARVVQEQVGQYLPTAGLVVDPLLDAVGILHPEHRLVVIPDDAGLGAYRADFAGLIGMFTDRPQEGADDTPGFAGSDRIVNTENFFDQLEEGGCDRVDAHGYLAARLMDLVVGDRDRHAGQWRWARFPEGEDCWVWRTVPEDRDQAFVRNDGFIMWLYRLVRPQQVKFGPEYPSLVGLSFNGWEVDRRLLPGLDEDAWREVASRTAAALTDEVIEDAVRRLPEPHYAQVGSFLERSLKARRDALVEEALEYYRLLSREVDVEISDRDEEVVLEHLDDGTLRMAVAFGSGPRSGRPYLERTFDPDVTREVRLYLHGGDDRVTVLGGRGRIEVRAIGGGGDDTFRNRSRATAGDTRFYDDRGDNDVEGSVRFDQRAYERPPATNLAHRYALDWGSLTTTLPQIGYDPDLGLKLGLQVRTQRYGFREDPTRSEVVRRLVVAPFERDFHAEWVGRFRTVMLGADVLAEGSFSSLDVLNYYGLGAGTVESASDDFYEVARSRLRLSPGLEWAWGFDRPAESEQEIDQRSFRPMWRLGLAPVLQWSDTPADRNEGTLIGELAPAPEGFGSYGQLGMRAWVEVDRRDSPAYPTSGLRVEGGAEVYPTLWDVSEPFGEVHGTASVYLTPGRSRRAPTLALRAGGKRVFGSFPFHEAAFLGGAANLRGSREERFAGRGSVFANAELRLPLARFAMLFPTEIGIQGVGDAGRVFVPDDPTDADAWHTGFGGGVWLSLLNRTQSFSVTLVNGADQLALYVQGGVLF